MKQICYLLFLPLLLASCRQVPSVEPQERCDLNLVVDLQAPSVVGQQVSRLNASWLSFVSGDRIGLQLVEWVGSTDVDQTLGVMESSGNHTDNQLFELSSLGSWSSSPLTSPATWRKFAVYGYFPYRASVGDLLKMKIEPRADQSAGIVSSDFALRGVGTTDVKIRNGAALTLNFAHLLTQLKVAVTLPSTYGGKATGAITSVTVVGTPASALLNMESGVMTSSQQMSTIKMNSDGATYQAVVVPCTIAASETMVRVDFTYSDASAGSLFCYAPSGGVTLAPSSIHTVTLSASDLSFASQLSFPNATLQTLPVSVVTNMTELWSVTSKTEWLTLTDDAVNQSGSKEVQVTAKLNITGQPRIGKLTLSNGKLSRDLAVRQN